MEVAFNIKNASKYWAVQREEKKRVV